MKKIVSSITLLLIIFSACNNKDQTSKENVNIPEKERQLKEAIKAHPDSAILTENLVQYYRESGNYSDAIKTATDLLQKDTMNDYFWNMAAELYYENGDTTQAIKAFEKAVEINPIPEYVLSLGSAYAQTRNPQALVVADALLGAYKANAQQQALFIKGLYYNYNNEKEKAIGYFDQCLALNYTNMMAYREKAICLYDLGKYKEAIQLLDKAITLQNSYEEGYYWLGRCFEKTGQTSAAIESYKAALDLDKNYIEARDALAKLGVKY